jgi:hypothetical protein
MEREKGTSYIQPVGVGILSKINLHAYVNY